MNEKYYIYLKNQANMVNLPLKDYLRKFVPQYENLVLSSEFYKKDNPYDSLDYYTEPITVPVVNNQKSFHIDDDYKPLSEDIKKEIPKEIKVESLIIKKNKK